MTMRIKLMKRKIGIIIRYELQPPNDDELPMDLFRNRFLRVNVLNTKTVAEFQVESPAEAVKVEFRQNAERFCVWAFVHDGSRSVLHTVGEGDE